MKFLKKEKGFTLIELLVVVSIIGVLATLVLSSLSNARSRSRDARRLADIRTIQTALEVYYVDNGTYPPATRRGYFTQSAGSNWEGSKKYDWEGLETEMGVTLPVDPINIWFRPYEWLFYAYYAGPDSWSCNGQAYMLIFQLESRKGDGSNNGVTLCNGYRYGESGNSTNEHIFYIGVDRDGNFITPNLSGSLREEPLR